MDIIFDRGDSQNPRGHALLYFRVDTEPDKVYATYVVTLPVKSDLTKYVPPFLASHLGNMPLSDLSAFAMPPVPEAIGSFAELERMSQLREDDLVYGGNMFSFDLARMMEMATEAVQVYSGLCSDALAMNSTPTEGAAAAIGEEGPQRRPEELAPLIWFEDIGADDRLWGLNPTTYRIMQTLKMLPNLTGPMGGTGRNR